MIMSAAPPATLTWEGVTARRMARHALAEPVTELGLAGIAGVLCGAHAQVLSAAELSIGRRIAGATRADVQRALWQDRMLVKTFGPRGAGLEQVHLDGKPAWIVADDTGTPPEPHRGLRLLPYFDAYVVAGQPRHRLYPGPAAARALTPAGQAGNYPVLLIDGVVGGVWYQRRSGRKLTITVEPLRELTAAQLRQLDDEIALVGTVMEATATLTLGLVTVGAHA